VKYVDFKLAMTDETIIILQVLKKLGLLESKTIEVRGSKVAPLDLLNAVIPTPVTAAETVSGHTGIVVEVKGRTSGAEMNFRLSTFASHEKAYGRFKQNATSFLTGVVPAIFVRMLAEGKIGQKGVVPPESLDSDAILRELTKEGVHTRITRSERRKL
jgi:saccharopine dehydrogenase-like NADP-dependent oxidoreductase